MTNGFVRDQTDRYTSLDNVAQGSLTFVHERGFLARLSDSYVTKLFTDTDVTELKNAQYNLTDADLSYELPGKQAKATFAITNIFNREFNSWLEGLMMERPRPQRHAVLTLQVRY